MNSKTLVAVITGANRGIGEGLCKLLATFDSPLVVYAASRAGKNLEYEESKNVTFVYPTLDITNETSVRSLAETIKSSHKGLDVLINNAGINILPGQQQPVETKMQILDVNHRGTLQMCKMFVPIMSPNGRIVNLSSVASSLSQYSPELRERFRNPEMRWKDLEALVVEWQDAARDNNEISHGWPDSAYPVSKACINAMTAILSRDYPGLRINACCPGWVATDMGDLVGSPTKTAADGAKIPYRLGFKDIDDVTGRYWANDSVNSRAEGRVQTW